MTPEQIAKELDPAQQLSLIRDFNRCLSALEILRKEQRRIGELYTSTLIAAARAHKAIEDGGCDLVPIWPTIGCGERDMFLAATEKKEI